MLRPRALWGRWWFLPGGIPLAYLAFVSALGDARLDHFVIVGLACVLAYLGPRTKAFFTDIWPYLAFLIGYDALRYPRQLFLTADRVLGCGLRDAELALFPAPGGQTWQDFAQAHTSTALDLICAVPYAIFAYLVLAYAAYLYVVDRPRMRHYLWAFVIANYLSFAIWLALPAAPPWYLRAHGCSIDVAALPSTAGLSRVDALLGVPYFQSFYSRASNVFGAVPSMHCAYPLIGLLTAWNASSWKTRPLHIAYLLSMFLAAVYLDHHWILDAVAGWLIAVVAVVLSRQFLVRMGLDRHAVAPAPARQPAW